MGFLNYNIQSKGSEKDYPSWRDGKPNLQTFLTAINQSNPIIQAQYELVWSRWPRTIFFAKNIQIPGVTVNTIEISHAGFTVPIPTFPKYKSNEISMKIIADKEGYHYYDLRNAVLATGHPLVAGDPKARIGNNFNINTPDDCLDVKLRNNPEDKNFHHWIVHNFHPTGIGSIDLDVESSNFVDFDLSGTFTHIEFLCGEKKQKTSESQKATEQQNENEREEENEGHKWEIMQAKLDSQAMNESQQRGESDNSVMQMTQLTLPNRFGMYKTPKTFSKTTSIELQIPPSEPIEDKIESDSDHRVRSIF